MSERIILLESRDAQNIHDLVSPKLDDPIHLPLNAVQLAQKRCESIARILAQFNIDFNAKITISHPSIRDILVHKAEQVQSMIPALWKHRTLTASYQYRKGDTMYYGDGTYAISHKGHFDYSDISDGGVKVLNKDELCLDRAIPMPMSEYLAAR